MPNHPRDPNQFAKRIVDLAVGTVEDGPAPEYKGEDPAAQAEMRRKRTRMAARARWDK